MCVKDIHILLRGGGGGDRRLIPIVIRLLFPFRWILLVSRVMMLGVDLRKRNPVHFDLSVGETKSYTTPRDDVTV